MTNNALAKDQISYDRPEAMRLDLFLLSIHPEVSRSIIQRSIEKGLVLVNGKTEKSNYKLRHRENISYLIENPQIDIEDIPAQNIPLEIIFENKDVIVINKQSDLSSHPTPNQTEQTLVNALLFHQPTIRNAVYDPLDPKSRVRAGIVHRLDKNTTGTMIIAKNTESMIFLSQQIRERSVTKKYLGLCFGWPQNSSGTISNYLSRDTSNRKIFSVSDQEHGKNAVTEYKVLNYYTDKLKGKYSLIEFSLITGRTHQIRAHCKAIDTPIMGDKLYFSMSSNRASLRLGVNRQLLHSKSLDIILPHHRKSSHFESPLPLDFEQILAKLTIS